MFEAVRLIVNAPPALPLREDHVVVALVLALQGPGARLVPLFRAPAGPARVLVVRGQGLPVRRAMVRARVERISRSGGAEVAALIYGVVPVQGAVPGVLFGVVGVFKVVTAF